MKQSWKPIEGEYIDITAYCRIFPIQRYDTGKCFYQIKMINKYGNGDLCIGMFESEESCYKYIEEKLLCYVGENERENQKNWIGMA